MGRGKIEIKKIENSTNRQVTYSKRRNGIFKKAQELTVLCDAKVSIIMLSGSGKNHEYHSLGTSTKEIYNQYQKTRGIDLWNTHYERMQEQLWQLKEINNKLWRENRQRIGEDLKDLSMDQLHVLEDKIEESLKLIRGRKIHDIKTKTNTSRKKVKNLKEMHGNLLVNLEEKCEEVEYGIVENDGEYESTVAFANGVSNLYAFHHLHPNNLHHGHGGGLGLHDLRLA